MKKKDLTGEVVLGFGGFTDMTPCIYRDMGWYDGTVEEYNVRRVECVKLLEEIDWHPLISEIIEGKSYGCRWGGGISGLYEIDEETASQLIAENNKIVAEKRAKEEAKEKAAAEKAAARETFKASLKCDVLKSGKKDNDFYAVVRLTKDGESLEFTCRNLFDVGYVVNPNYAVAEGLEEGGVTVDGKWRDFKSGEGWVEVRELTDFEKHCIKYLNEFSPVETGVRL